jgi:hypothetical protein
VPYLPPALKDQLAAAGIDKPFRLTFRQPAPAGVEYVHRAHPLVAAIADHVAERGLAEDRPLLAARCGAIFSDGVAIRTTLYLLRLRSQLTVETLTGGKASRRRTLLSEECLTVAVRDGAEPAVLDETQALALMATEPSRNMTETQRGEQIAFALEDLAELDERFTAIAEDRAETLLADHTRVRAAAGGRGEALGVRYHVQAALPVDVIGVYVLLPAPRAL